MTFSNETKLSNILARMIVAPEDRSQLLPLTTPIYCPDNNGVTANKVQIINPNLGFLYDNTIRETSASINIPITIVGNPTIEGGFVTNQSKDNGIAIDFQSILHQMNIGDTATIKTKIHPNNTHTSNYMHSQLVSLYKTTDNTHQALIELGGGTGQVDMYYNLHTTFTGQYLPASSRYFDIQINITLLANNAVKFDYSITYKNITDDTLVDTTRTASFTTSSSYMYDTPFILNFGYSSQYDATTVMKVDLSNTSISIGGGSETITTSQTRRTVGGKSTIIRNLNSDGEVISTEGVDAGLNTEEFKNVQDITMDQPLILSYTVPHEVDLETNVDLVNLIKADFAVKFKAAVSNYVLNYLKVNKNTITTITHGDTLAQTLGKVIADNAENGTGQKFSIYKYSNGAPVPYNFTSNQPNIDKVILKKPDTDDTCEVFMSDYACINDINVPALYYCEQPTIILPHQAFEDYQVARLTGDIKDYADKKLNVDAADVVLTDIGEAIYGSNDVFAVAFTQPKIVESDNTEFFAKDVTIAIYYGVALVNDKNLRIIE